MAGGERPYPRPWPRRRLWRLPRDHRCDRPAGRLDGDGGLVGKGYGEAAGSGLRTSVTLVFFALLGFSTYHMIMQSTKMVYDGPMDAVLGIFDFMMENGQAMLTAGVLGILGVGGVLGGIAAEWASRKWR